MVSPFFGQEASRRQPVQNLVGKGLADNVVADLVQRLAQERLHHKIARQGFGRGLCPVGDRFVAGGSSPSTVSLYDLDSNQKVGSVNLTMDIRNAIHGLELWPYS